MTHGASSDLLETLRRTLGGHYDVERLLGAGGMGSVFLARDRILEREVAIKVFGTDATAGGELRERFTQEARLVARLRHPNIVTVYTAGEVEGLLYFVMEYVPGEGLRDRLAREPRYDGHDAMVVVRDLARALAYAHAHGVVHRDVKPENVLLDAESGRAMLADFGVARAFGTGAGLGGDARMTHTGMVVGSPRYMSPEQAAGERTIDGRSDIYSLGLIAYEMIAGAPVVSATTPGAALVQVITQKPAPLATRPDVPQGFVDVIDRALEKDPDARWATAAEMADALDAVLAGRPVIAAPPARAATAADAPTVAAAARPRERRIAALVVAGLLMVGAGLGVGTLLVRRASGAPAGVDPRKSFLVAPFEVMGSDPQVAWLRDGSVSMLSMNLAQWRDLEVVDYERSLDLLREAKLDDDRRIALEDARRMARRAGVWTVVMGQVTPTPDSLLVIARLYDVGSGRKIEERQRAAARAADPRPLYDALARDLLGLVGAPPITLELAKTTTGSVTAYRAYLEGERALNRWLLAAADSQFDAAIRADSTFALAYYKRALTRGWINTGEPLQRALLDAAVRHGARLPERQRDLVAAYRDLTMAFARQREGADTGVVNGAFTSAQRRYAAIVARDSSDAEAWYGYGDALWHHTPDGWGQPRTAGNWTRALRAFDRTLMLDSSFHLAYSHRLDVFRQASGGGPVVIDGDSLRFIGTPEAARAFGPPERIRAARDRARALAIREARGWTRADPVPQAYIALVGVYGTAGQLDSALAALDEAQAIPTARTAKLRIFAAGLTGYRNPKEGLARLRPALRETTPAQLRAEGGSDRWELLTRGAVPAAFGGNARVLDTLARLIGGGLETVGGTDLTGALAARWWELGLQAAMGMPASRWKRPLDSTLAAFERLPGRQGEVARRQFASTLYVLQLATRDSKYEAVGQRWVRDTGTFAEMEALKALAKGDTATARRLAMTFPDPDSAKAMGNGLSLARWVGRAEVWAELGEPRRAIANYEALHPARFNQNGMLDVSWPLWSRTFLARGRLYEQVGEREKAAEAYRKFLEMWSEADPALEPQKAEARAGLARLGDAPAATAVPRS